MLVSDQDTYIKMGFNNEAELESVVQKYKEQLFGSDIIFLPKAKITMVGGNGVIPDGFVIDAQDEEWFIVEVELASHGTWQHIAPQISKQLTAAETQATRDAVRDLALKELVANKVLRAMLNNLGISDLHITSKLQAILNKPPTIAIPIDAIPSDLREWVRTLRSTVKIWVIEKYVSEKDASRILYSLPEETPTVTTTVISGKSVSTVNTTGSSPILDLISAGLLTEGERLTMDYKPAGGQPQCFAGVVRNDGIEVDGNIYSPSYAALYCLHKVNNSRKSINGWTAWKTTGGIFLSALRNKLPIPTTQVPLSSDVTPDSLPCLNQP